MPSRMRLALVAVFLFIAFPTWAAGSPPLNPHQLSLLYCLHADKVRGDVSFELYAQVAGSAEPKWQAVPDLPNQKALLARVWRSLASGSEDMVVTCSWPEPAVSNSTLVQLKAFDPQVTMREFGLE